MQEKNVRYLFIDANIYIDFYRLDSSSLEKLSELVDILNSGDIELFLTKQVKEEFYRNREKVLKLSYDNFIKSNPYLNMSSEIFKSFGEYKTIKQLQRDLEQAKSKLEKEFILHTKNRTLNADVIIERIFNAAKFIESDAYISRARNRFDLGNPPGKNQSYGDAVNWEALLDNVPNNHNFVIISRDSDFKSPMFNDSVNDFLFNEWKVKKSSEVKLYDNLQQFFVDEGIKISLQVEDKKNQLILDLIRSGSYSTTHYIVSELSKYSAFSDVQIENLANALIVNTQVRWIVDDVDIKEFYCKFVKPRISTLESPAKEKLEIFLDTKKEDKSNIVQEEDFPF